MENTLHNKRKYFKIYQGQKILKDKIFNLRPKLNIFINDTDDNDYLELLPLNLINDELLLRCYHLHNAHIAYDNTMDFSSPIVMARLWFENGGENDIINTPQTRECVISEGYAVPCLGLSIDELIKYGWLVLKDFKVKNWYEY